MAQGQYTFPFPTRISNISDPTLPQDAASQAYVLRSISGGVGADFPWTSGVGEPTTIPPFGVGNRYWRTDTGEAYVYTIDNTVSPSVNRWIIDENIVGFAQDQIANLIGSGGRFIIPGSPTTAPLVFDAVSNPGEVIISIFISSPISSGLDVAATLNGLGTSANRISNATGSTGTLPVSMWDGTPAGSATPTVFAYFAGTLAEAQAVIPAGTLSNEVYYTGVNALFAFQPAPTAAIQRLIPPQLVAGTDISLTTDPATQRVTIAVTGPSVDRLPFDVISWTSATDVVYTADTSIPIQSVTFTVTSNNLLTLTADIPGFGPPTPTPPGYTAQVVLTDDTGRTISGQYETTAQAGSPRIFAIVVDRDFSIVVGQTYTMRARKGVLSVSGSQINAVSPSALNNTFNQFTYDSSVNVTTSINNASGANIGVNSNWIRGLKQYGLYFNKQYLGYDAVRGNYFTTPTAGPPWATATLTVPMGGVQRFVNNAASVVTLTNFSVTPPAGAPLIIGDTASTWTIQQGYFTGTGDIGLEAILISETDLAEGTYTVQVAVGRVESITSINVGSSPIVSLQGEVTFANGNNTTVRASGQNLFVDTAQASVSGVALAYNIGNVVDANIYTAPGAINAGGTVQIGSGTGYSTNSQVIQNGSGQNGWVFGGQRVNNFVAELGAQKQVFRMGYDGYWGTSPANLPVYGANGIVTPPRFVQELTNGNTFSQYFPGFVNPAGATQDLVATAPVVATARYSLNGGYPINNASFSAVAEDAMTGVKRVTITPSAAFGFTPAVNQQVTVPIYIDGLDINGSNYAGTEFVVSSATSSSVTVIVPASSPTGAFCSTPGNAFNMLIWTAGQPPLSTFTNGFVEVAISPNSWVADSIQSQPSGFTLPQRPGGHGWTIPVDWFENAAVGGNGWSNSSAVFPVLRTDGTLGTGTGFSIGSRPGGGGWNADVDAAYLSQQWINWHNSQPNALQATFTILGAYWLISTPAPNSFTNLPTDAQVMAAFNVNNSGGAANGDFLLSLNFSDPGNYYVRAGQNTSGEYNLTYRVNPAGDAQWTSVFYRHFSNSVDSWLAPNSLTQWNNRYTVNYGGDSQNPGLPQVLGVNNQTQGRNIVVNQNSQIQMATGTKFVADVSSMQIGQAAVAPTEGQLLAYTTAPGSPQLYFRNPAANGYYAQAGNAYLGSFPASPAGTLPVTYIQGTGNLVSWVNDGVMTVSASIPPNSVIPGTTVIGFTTALGVQGLGENDAFVAAAADGTWAIVLSRASGAVAPVEGGPTTSWNSFGGELDSQSVLAAGTYNNVRLGKLLPAAVNSVNGNQGNLQIVQGSGITVTTAQPVAGTTTVTIAGKPVFTWVDYLNRWTSAPVNLVTDNTATDGANFGNVTTYTPPVTPAVTLYRFIPQTYNPNFDGFYTTYNTMTKTVSGFVTSRAQ